MIERPKPGAIKVQRGNIAVIGVLIALLTVGRLVAVEPIVSLAVIGVLIVIVAIPAVEHLCVLMFWVLPYMVVNVPTGGLTLKLPEVTAYIFAAAYLIRAVLRRESIAAPPATAFVAVFLAVQCLAAIFAPPSPLPFLGGNDGPLDRNTPALRPASIIIWLMFSWLVVTAVYNVAGRCPDIFKKCVKAHILGSAVACLVSLAIFVSALAGSSVVFIGRSLAVHSGTNVLRLSGVAYEPLFLAFYLLTVIPVTAVVLLQPPTWMTRKMSGSVLILQLLTLALTFSAGGWAGLVMSGIILAPLFCQIKLSRKFVRTISAAVACLAITTTVVIAANSDYLKLIQTTIGKISEGGDTLRLKERETAYILIQKYPVFGVGPGLGNFLTPKYHPLFNSANLDSSTHEINNVILNTAAESGLVGLAALLVAAFVGFRELLRPIRRLGLARLPILAALLGSLIGCSLQYMSMNPLFLIYLSGLIALACAASRLAESDPPVDILRISVSS